MAPAGNDAGPQDHESSCLPASSDILELDDQRSSMRGGTGGTVHRHGHGADIGILASGFHSLSDTVLARPGWLPYWWREAGRRLLPGFTDFSIRRNALKQKRHGLSATSTAQDGPSSPAYTTPGLETRFSRLRGGALRSLPRRACVRRSLCRQRRRLPRLMPPARWSCR